MLAPVTGATTVIMVTGTATMAAIIITTEVTTALRHAMAITTTVMCTVVGLAQAGMGPTHQAAMWTIATSTTFRAAIARSTGVDTATTMPTAATGGQLPTGAAAYTSA